MEYTKNILIVDDENSILDLISSILKDACPNDHIFTANCAKIAMEKIKELNKKIDLVITDIKMPDINGFILAKSILELCPETRVIMMSAHVPLIEQINLFDIGVERIINKPFIIDHFIEAINTPIQKRTEEFNQMLPIRIEKLKQRNIYPFDLYVLLRNEKIIKIFNKNNEVNVQRLNQFLAQDVSILYAKKSECLNTSLKLYVPIRASNLKIDKLVPFNVYYFQNDEYKLLLKNGTMLNIDIINIIKKYSLKNLFLEDTDEYLFRAYIEEYLDEYLKNTKISLEDRISTISDQVNSKLENIFTNLNSKTLASLTSSQKQLENFIKIEKSALTSLLELNQKEQSTHVHSLIVASLSYAMILEIINMRKFPELHSKIRALDEFTFDSEETRDIIFIGAVLHDIGKVLLNLSGIIFQENSRSELKEIYNTHSDVAYNHLKNYSEIPLKALEIIEQHEEFCDGTGFPNKLYKTEMSFFAQIISITNYYDKLHRYHHLSDSEILEDIKKNQVKFNKYLIPVLERVLTNKN
jgi:response regulator RpfG family c-di-GMP phosphodiesterase